MDNQQDSRQPRKGPISRGIDAVNTGRTIGQGIKLARTVGAIGDIFSSLGIIGIIAIILLGISVFALVGFGDAGEAAGIPGETDQNQPSSGTSVNGIFSQTKLPNGSYIPIIISPAQEACVSRYEGAPGVCSPDDLLQSFQNNRNKAIVASLICQAESGSRPDAKNDKCSTNDYSIGLFQINAVANCSVGGANAYSDTASCNSSINYSIRAQCESDWKIPAENIKKAYALSSGGTLWEPYWGTWDNSNGFSPAIHNILTQCGISF